MPILHVEHSITDLDTWLQTFGKFAPAREQAGVLRFESVDAAANFRTFLTERVWSSPETSPALVGTPRAVILTEVTPTAAS